MTSFTPKPIARYSDSAEDMETVGCFLDFQDISDEPKNIQYPVVDRLLSLQDPQSASVKALSVILESAE